MNQPLPLNEQMINYKLQGETNQIEGISSKQSKTLDEPIIDTIKRDLVMIGQKIILTLSGSGNYTKMQKQWDLWGPSVISLFTASLVALSSSGQAQQIFTTIIIALWVGPLMIIVNCHLLGTKVPLIQSLCIILYCSSPILILALIIFMLNWFLHSFFLNLIFSAATTIFIVHNNVAYLRKLVKSDHTILGLYPIILFYTFIALYISMT